MGKIWQAVYGFFTSKDTPGSGFYVALLGVLGNFGTYALDSGNPWLMVAGAACAGVYGAAHALGARAPAKSALTVALPDVVTSPAPAAVAQAYPDSVAPGAPAYAAPQPQVGSDAPIVDETAHAAGPDIIGVTVDPAAPK